MIEPIEKTLSLPIPASRAFELFTSRMADWWPLATHSLSAGSDELPKSLEVEPHVGGLVLETLFDGSTQAWGRITSWQPPRLFAMTWHVGRPEDQASHVSFGFEDTATGCTLRLVHDNWEALGDQGQSLRDNYQTGWDCVLGDYRGQIEN